MAQLARTPENVLPLPDGLHLRFTLSGHQGEIYRPQWSPDGNQLATPGSDNTIRIWKLQDGQPLPTLVGHTDRVFGIAWSPDSARLASIARDKTVRLWNMTSYQQILSIP